MDMVDPNLQLHLQRAKNALENGSIPVALGAYERVLQLDANNVEALNFLAATALTGGETARGLGMLRRATAIAPTYAPSWITLGLAYQDAGRFDEARNALQCALANDPQSFVARLHLGSVQEQLDDRYAALSSYYAAIAAAQQQGVWIDLDSTTPALRPRLGRAMRFIEQFKPRLFAETLEPLLARFGKGELLRVERFLSGELRSPRPQSTDLRQKPKLYFFPGLTAQPFLDRKHLPWLDALEQRTDAIRQEAQAMLAEGEGLEPFLKLSPGSNLDDYLRGDSAPPAWDGFFFYRHGDHFGEHARRCPQTSAALAALPLVHIRNHAPEVLFSVLRPGTHIMPHYGVTNTRVVVHLPLLVPEECALRAGGETQVWQEGRCLVFDDTYEHEAWNRSAAVRVILLLDVWHPLLSEAERVALAELIPLMGMVEDAIRAG